MVPLYKKYGGLGRCFVHIVDKNSGDFLFIVVQVLPNDSTRISDEGSLLVTDILVELEDGSLANVEVQRVGYLFPGQRAACYGADLLLRQYKRVRSKMKKKFSYKQIKNVYTIVFFEHSGKEFQDYPLKRRTCKKIKITDVLRTGDAFRGGISSF